MERARRFRRTRFRPEEAVEPDPTLVTAAANLLSVMTGIPDQPMELKRMSAQDAMLFASTIRDPEALAFILRVIFQAYGIDEEEWVRAVSGLPSAV